MAESHIGAPGHVTEIIVSLNGRWRERTSAGDDEENDFRALAPILHLPHNGVHLLVHGPLLRIAALVSKPHHFIRSLQVSLVFFPLSRMMRLTTSDHHSVSYR